MKLLKHHILHITHNDHNASYCTVEQEIEARGYDFRNDEQKQRCIDTDELWEMQWYPNTPIGFNLIAAPTLNELLEFALEVESETE